MKNTYIIVEDNGHLNHAGSKARNDVENILKNKGFNELRVKKFFDSNGIVNKIKIMFKSTIDWLRILKLVNKNSTILIQYPLESPKKIVNIYVKLIKKIKDVKFICLIHDLESLRFSRNSDKNETKFLNEYEYIIAHNENMKKYLKNRGINENKIIALGVFDYIIKNDNSNYENERENYICIAGNLSDKKSPYLYKLNNLCKEINFALFGPNYSIDKNLYKNIKYMGQFTPENLINELNGKYGLVWDGDSLDTCSGITGSYLMYNNPHKLSLYIVSNLPVIVWSKSAMAKFVEEQKIGFTINSLYDLEDNISKITEEQYSEMLKNIHVLSLKLESGFFLKNAINQINI